MVDRRFQDYSGRSFGDATDGYELNPYSEDFSTPAFPDQSAGPNGPRPGSAYSFTESIAPVPPSSYPLTEPYAPQRVAAGLSQASGYDHWVRRHAPAPAGGLKRYPTRKVKLVQGSVLSIDYPVPSAILNSTQPRYKSGDLASDEEFAKMRCRLL